MKISYSFQLSSFIRFYGICFALLACFYFIEAESIVCLQDSKVFSNNHNLDVDEIMGLADIDKDGFTDIFYATDNRSQLNVMLMNGDSTYTKRELIRLNTNSIRYDHKIRSILMEKFVDETILDILLLISLNVSGPYKVHFNHSTANIHQHVMRNQGKFIGYFMNQPLPFYYSQNNLAELLAIDSATTTWRIWHEGKTNYDITREISSLNEQIPWIRNNKQSMHSLFFDIDMDDFKEVMLTDYNSNFFKFYKHSTIAPHTMDFTKPYKEIQFPPNANKILKPIAADWCLKNRVELLLAYCIAINCEDDYSRLGVFNINDDTDWIDVPIRENLSATTNNDDNAAIHWPLITSMQKADLNMDNYPDVVATLMDEENNSFIGIFTNQCSGGRLAFSMKQFEHIQASEVIPFDFMENGILDLLTNCEKSMKIYKVNLEEKSFNSGRCDFFYSFDHFGSSYRFHRSNKSDNSYLSNGSDNFHRFNNSDSSYRSTRSNKLQMLIIVIIVVMVVVIGLVSIATLRYFNVLHTVFTWNQGLKHNLVL